MTIETRIYDALNESGLVQHAQIRLMIAQAVAAELFPIIATVDELDALPVGTVVRCGFGVVRERKPGERAWTGGASDFGLPARVIDRPERNEP